MGGRHAPAALSPGKTRYPLHRRLGGPHGRSGRVRKISLPPWFDPLTVQPAASRCTACVIPAQSNIPLAELTQWPPCEARRVCVLSLLIRTEATGYWKLIEIDSTCVLSSSLYQLLTSCDVNLIEATPGFKTCTQFQCTTKNYITDLGSFCTSKPKAVRCFQNGVCAQHVKPLIGPQPTVLTKHTKLCGAVQVGVAWKLNVVTLVSWANVSQ